MKGTLREISQDHTGPTVLALSFRKARIQKRRKRVIHTAPVFFICATIGPACFPLRPARECDSL